MRKLVILETFIVSAAIAWPWYSMGGQANTGAAAVGPRPEIGEQVQSRGPRRVGPMEIKGTITDQNGNALDEVRVDVDRVVPQLTSSESKNVRRKVVVSGSFTIQLEPCSSARIWFRKDGYSAVFVDILYRSENPKSNDPYSKVSFRGDTKVIEDLDVVLRNEQGVTRLASFGPYLRIKPNGDHTVYDLDNPHRRGGPEVDHAYGESTLKAGMQFSSGTLYAKLLPSLRNPAPLLEAGEYLWPPGQDVVVVLDDRQGGGFLRAIPKRDKRFGKKSALWHMREAPPGPYTKQLKVTQDNLDMFRRGEYMEFYSKCHGKFGKGRLRVGYSQQEGVTVITEFLYQPDGSRNVETSE